MLCCGFVLFAGIVEAGSRVKLLADISQKKKRNQCSSRAKSGQQRANKRKLSRNFSLQPRGTGDN